MWVFMMLFLVVAMLSSDGLCLYIYTHICCAFVHLRQAVEKLYYLSNYIMLIRSLFLPVGVERRQSRECCSMAIWTMILTIGTSLLCWRCFTRWIVSSLHITSLHDGDLEAINKFLLVRSYCQSFGFIIISILSLLVYSQVRQN